MEKNNSNFNQLCVWQGVTLGEYTNKDFEKFMQNQFNVKIKFEACIETLPNLDVFNNPIKNTGGRFDLFFYIHDEDIQKFAVPRLSVGIRRWEDVLNNKNNYLYSKEFIASHPKLW